MRNNSPGNEEKSNIMFEVTFLIVFFHWSSIWIEQEATSNSTKLILFFRIHPSDFISSLCNGRQPSIKSHIKQQATQ